MIFQRCLGFWAFTKLVSPVFACSLSINVPSAIPRDNSITHILIEMRHAAFSSLDPIPAGWLISIANDANYITKLAGQGIDGVFFLTPADIAHMVHVKPEPGYYCASIPLHDINIQLRYYIGGVDKEKSIKLMSRDFSISD